MNLMSASLCLNQLLSMMIRRLQNHLEFLTEPSNLFFGFTDGRALTLRLAGLQARKGTLGGTFGLVVSILLLLLLLGGRAILHGNGSLAIIYPR